MNVHLPQIIKAHQCHVGHSYLEFFETKLRKLAMNNFLRFTLRTGHFPRKLLGVLLSSWSMITILFRNLNVRRKVVNIKLFLLIFASPWWIEYFKIILKWAYLGKIQEVMWPEYSPTNSSTSTGSYSPQTPTSNFFPSGFKNEADVRQLPAFIEN